MRIGVFDYELVFQQLRNDLPSKFINMVKNLKMKIQQKLVKICAARNHPITQQNFKCENLSQISWNSCSTDPTSTVSITRLNTRGWLGYCVVRNSRWSDIENYFFINWLMKHCKGEMSYCHMPSQNTADVIATQCSGSKIKCDQILIVTVTFHILYWI